MENKPICLNNKQLSIMWTYIAPNDDADVGFLRVASVLGRQKKINLANLCSQINSNNRELYEL